MTNLIVYYAHPGHKYSHANCEMSRVAAEMDGITYVDLYRDYPRFDIDADIEQQRLLEHDVILFQFPMFWYSTPSIIKEWQDLVLEHGFAYGSGGDKLAGKRMLLAITAAGPEDAYSPGGYQRHSMRDFLRPLEQTARLCRMIYLAPFVVYGTLGMTRDRLHEHARNYRRFLEALRDGRLNLDAAGESGIRVAGLPSQ